MVATHQDKTNSLTFHWTTTNQFSLTMEEESFSDKATKQVDSKIFFQTTLPCQQ